MHRNDESFQEVMKTTRHAPARPGVEDFGVDLKDINTGVHSTRLAEWAIRVARKMNIPEDRLYQVEIAALLHGVGIIGVPDAILKKAGPLTDEERTLINRHPEYSWSILRRFPGLEEASLLCTITKVWTAQAIPQDCKAPTSRSCQESSLSSTPTMRGFEALLPQRPAPRRSDRAPASQQWDAIRYRCRFSLCSDHRTGNSRCFRSCWNQYHRSSLAHISKGLVSAAPWLVLSNLRKGFVHL